VFGFAAMQSPAQGKNPEAERLAMLPALAGMALVIVGIYVMTFAPTSAMGSAIVGTVASLPLIALAVGVGWILVTFLGPVGLPIYGVILGLATWGALWWIRGWRFWAGTLWQGNQGAFASFLSRMNEEGNVSLKGAEGMTLIVPWSKWMEHRQIFASSLANDLIRDELVTYITPGGTKFGGTLQVTRQSLYFQFRLPVVGQLAQLQEDAIIQNTAVLYGLPPGAVRYARRQGEVVFVVTIPTSNMTDIQSAHGWITHRAVVKTSDGLTHQFKYGIFPDTQLLNALRNASMPRAAVGQP
jgi:hypothetical protein